MELEIHWPEDFITLSRGTHFFQAANQTGVTGQAFSGRTHALNDWLGVELIQDRPMRNEESEATV